jgi:hypothetical protein
MSNQDSIIAQVTCMRERSIQLCVSALQWYPANSPVVIRLQLIHDQLCALEATFFPRTMSEKRDRRFVFLSEGEVEQIASAIAKKLGVFNLDGETTVVPLHSNRLS